MRLFFLLCGILFALNATFSQNLLRNPSFEENSSVPMFMALVDNLVAWQSVVATPDYLHEGGFPPGGGFLSDFFPNSGDAGVFMASGFNADNERVGEAIGQVLDIPLVDGGLYNFSGQFRLNPDITEPGAIKVYGLIEPQPIDASMLLHVVQIPNIIELAEIDRIFNIDQYEERQVCFLAPEDISYLIIAADNGFVYLDDVSLEAVLPPELVYDFLGKDTLVCSEDGLTLDLPFNYDAVSWNDSLSILPRTLFSGTFSLNVQLGFCSVADTIRVETEFCNPPNLFIPNVFSPNDDGFNDELVVFTNGIFEQYSLRIYDRWGGLVFETNQAGESWDGKIKGESAPIGNYLLQLEYRFLGDPQPNIHPLVQDVQLLR